MADLGIVKRLREVTQASISDCQDALEEAAGDFEKALKILKAKGLARAGKKTSREVGPGIIDAYVHPGGQVGALVEIRCETDFVARNEEFKKLAHELCLQVASMSPLWIAPDDIPEEILEEEKRRIRAGLSLTGKSDAILEKATEGKLEDYFRQVCLLRQSYIKNPDETIEDLISATIAKVGENIKVSNFCRLDI